MMRWTGLHIQEQSEQWTVTWKECSPHDWMSKHQPSLKPEAGAGCKDSDVIFHTAKKEELCWYCAYIYNICLWIQINRLFTQPCVSKAPSRNSSISMLWSSGEIKYSLSVMRVPGCIQVRWLSCAVQIKWPMTYHTRRYSKTDHLLHVQQYLLYGWLKWMRTFHVSTGMRVKRDECRDQSWVK